MVATAEISPTLKDGDLAVPTEPVLTGKLSSFAEPETAPSAKEETEDTTPWDENERADVDEPRVDAVASAEETTEEEAVAETTPESTTTGEMSEEAVQEVLERYAFGAGMRMYARSLALAELAEKEKAAKTLKKAPSSSLGEQAPLKTVPSAKSVLSFESVKSEISKLVQSLGSQDRGTADENKARDLEAADENKAGDLEVGEEEDDDVVDAITQASEETEPQGSTGLCGADDALADLYHQAEIWAEKTYDSMARESRRKTRSAKRSYNKWWSSMFSRKSRAVKAEQLSLEEASLMDAAPPEKPWWSSILCAPVILDEDETPLPDDDKLQAATEPDAPMQEKSTSESTKSQWELPFTGMIQKWFTKKAVEPTETPDDEDAAPEHDDAEIPAPVETEPISEVAQQNE